MRPQDYGNRLPTWFHRANWAGGALACFAIGAYPIWQWGGSLGSGSWCLLWVFLGAGAANNARRGVNSIHIPSRFRRR